MKNVICKGYDTQLYEKRKDERSSRKVEGQKDFEGPQTVWSTHYGWKPIRMPPYPLSHVI